MSVGVVVIGRNEGERLGRCLKSLAGPERSVVYVDSGSTDASVALARSLGAEVVELDMGTPFTAARARNAGFERLLEQRAPDLAHVQFVDGDCEMTPGWLETAAAWLDSHPDVAMVCGRLRERHPERTIYNLLCDIEWDAPAGEARACGGIALARTEAFEQARGYRPDLIAGEEPELCVRLRARGWKIWRLADEMALHDAAMTRFGQWWQRSVRAGYAYAEGAFLHGDAPERHRIRESRRAWIWGIALPLAILAAIALAGPWGMSLLALYPLQIMRLSLGGGRPLRERLLRAAFIVLGKFPEAAGQIKFRYHHLTGVKARLIEYK
ncbi:MAG: glycosyltransferase family A protein [Pseudomonadota bacterium]|nr:glycosyltransferase family A protein [Pseudomonadota bacterium]